MNDRPSRPPTLQALFAEMKRRRVFKVMAVYGAVAFVVLQIADIAFEPLGLPAWTMTFVLVLAMLGFPIAVVLAWAFESTPEGMKRTEPARPEEIEEMVAAPRSQRWPAGILALLGMALLFGTGWWMGGGGNGGEPRSANLLVSEAQASDLRAIAALPFEDVNDTDENRLIAVGIHDDLLTRLSRIGDFRVTSRTSVREYEAAETNLRDIAGELGVDYIIEGSVRSSGNQVRVNVSLVDLSGGASEQTVLWSDQYDHEVTPESLFDIQAEIAQAVVRELEAQLSPEEEAAIESMRPAASSVAQQWYYRGIEAWERGNAAIVEARDAMLRAVASDTNFVAAWSQLAKFESRLNFLGYPRLDEAEAAMERTEELAPGSVEAHMARGYVEYYGRLNYDAALSSFRAAERLAPSNTEVTMAVGLILRRQGEWEASIESAKRAVVLDPRNAEPLQFLALNLAFYGAFRAADEVFERGLAFAPGNPGLRSGKIANLANLDRDPRRARRLANELALDPDQSDEARTLVQLASFERDFDAAEPLRLVGPEESAFNRAIAWVWQAQLYRFGGRSAQATTAADSALAITDDIALIEIEETSFRGWAHALAGRPEEAMPMFARAERLIRSWRDHVDATTYAVNVVDGYGLLGEVDRGLDLLGELIDRPALELTVASLRLDPRFDPFREDPRFDELIERRERFESEAAEWAEENGPWLP